MNAIFRLILTSTILLASCGKEDPAPTDIENCPANPFADNFSIRNFRMGFSTWSYDATLDGRNQTYSFLRNNGDVYSEHIDNKIPWSAWMNGTDLPVAFVNEIQGRVDNKISSNELVVSVSLLNSARSELAEDFDGTVPAYISLADQSIEDAYFKHLDYIIQQFEPDYFVMAIEVNELRIHSPQKWAEYKVLAGNLRSRLKSKYPNLKLSESITLHNWLNPNVSDPQNFISDVSTYVNQNLDFAAISFYPFFKNFHLPHEFKSAFDFLHEQVEKPIAFVETSHLAEDLVIEAFNTNITSNVCEQKAYLEMLLNSAQTKNYEFVIWWAHRDFDALWETFPEEVKDLGRVWRDTGLLDEKGDKRPAFGVWEDVFESEFQN